MLPVPPPEEKPGVKASDAPDLVGVVVLIALWALLFTFGPLWFYSPPRLKPRWLHLVALTCSFVLWAVLGGFLIREGSLILGAVVILVAIGGAGFALLQIGTSATPNAERQKP